ncbi:Hypothetical predicted protein, partial [Mytilus galloprovincialis]
CQRPSRRLKVGFECSWFWWFDKDFTVSTCSNSLAEVKCSQPKNPQVTESNQDTSS